MDILGQRVTGLGRVARNESSKGYYPTAPADVAWVAGALDPRFPWGRSARNLRLTVFDPCAGAGDFLSAVKRALKEKVRLHLKDTAAPGHRVAVETYAVEIDESRFERIQGTRQKLLASAFDVKVSGQFSVVLLNPPYHRGDDQLLAWLRRAVSWVSYGGKIVFLLPDYEWGRAPMQDYVRENLAVVGLFHSEQYQRFRQVVAILTRDRHSARVTFPVAEGKFSERPERWRAYYSLDVPPLEEASPLLLAHNMDAAYQKMAEQVSSAGRQALSIVYPQRWETALAPAMTLRAPHAIMLAATNSEIEPVEIDGRRYLAKYMVRMTDDVFEHPDGDGYTVVRKPTVEPFLLSEKGEVQSAKDAGYDILAVNRELSSILLRRLRDRYEPVHEVGADDAVLPDSVRGVGLLPPQREVVKATLKLFRTGQKGVLVRGTVGTGKTYVARGVLVGLGVRRAAMVTLPQLVPQLAEEYAHAEFAVHVIDSWARARELARTRPDGLYLIAYTRLREHPKHEPCFREARRVTRNEAGDAVSREGFLHCPDCFHPGPEERFRKGDKLKCPGCGSPWYTYVAENEKPPRSYGRWLRQVDAPGAGRTILSHSKQLPYIRWLKKMRFEFCVMDEAHEAANLVSNQGTAFIRLAGSVPRVLALTATVTNGMAKSLYNLLWGCCPRRMEEDGWDRTTSARWQATFGAFAEVHKTDNSNRHRTAETVTTKDIAGISPMALKYVLPILTTMDAEDFDDRPPVERRYVRCTPHPEVEGWLADIERILDHNVSAEDRRASASVRTAAVLRSSDVFCHYDDELALRGERLGTVRRRDIGGVLHEKEERLVEVAREAASLGERCLVVLGTTQKIDMRPVLQRILREHAGVSVEILEDRVPPGDVMDWFREARAQTVIASYKRAGVGLNLSQFTWTVWWDMTSNPRLLEQTEGRIRRVNTAKIHRELFGEVRPVRYVYLVNSEPQALLLSYVLEKNMIARLAEGETPEVDPSECSSGDQSFSALLTRCLQEGSFEYTDPSALLKRMTRFENEGLGAAAAPPPSLTVRGEVEALGLAPVLSTSRLRGQTMRPVQLTLFS